MASVVLNVTLVFIVIVTVCFTIGDQAEVAATPTFYPFIQMLQRHAIICRDERDDSYHHHHVRCLRCF
jgi:hypothetical protein